MIIGCITNIVANGIFVEIFGPIIDFFVLVLILMIFTVLSLIFKFFYNLFISPFVKKMEYKEKDISVLYSVGIFDLELTRKEFIDQFFQFKKNINIYDYDKLGSIASNSLIKSYRIDLERLKKLGYDLVFLEPEVMSCSIYNCRSDEYNDFVKMVLTIKRKEYIIDTNGKVIKGSEHKKNKNRYYLTYKKKNSHIIQYNCPVCDVLISSSDISFCGNCGCKLDSDTDCWKLDKIVGDVYITYEP